MIYGDIRKDYRERMRYSEAPPSLQIVRDNWKTVRDVVYAIKKYHKLVWVFDWYQN